MYDLKCIWTKIICKNVLNLKKQGAVGRKDQKGGDKEQQ